MVITQSLYENRHVHIGGTGAAKFLGNRQAQPASLCYGLKGFFGKFRLLIQLKHFFSRQDPTQQAQYAVSHEDLFFSEAKCLVRHEPIFFYPLFSV